MRTIGKRITIGSGIIAAVVMIWAGIAVKDVALEKWYLLKLHSNDTDQQDKAIANLAKMKSIHASPFLISLLTGKLSPYSISLTSEDIRRQNIYRELLIEMNALAIPEILKALYIKYDPFIERSLLEIIHRIGPDAIQAADYIRGRIGPPKTYSNAVEEGVFIGALYEMGLEYKFDYPAPSFLKSLGVGSP